MARNLNWNVVNVVEEEVYPTSEVGSGSNLRSNLRSSEKCDRESDNDKEKWSQLLQVQNNNMRNLIEALIKPQVTEQFNLSEFNPDDRDADARAWCSMAELCIGDKNLTGAKLIMTLSRAMKGAASSWLSQISYPDISWEDFKSQFAARFIQSETMTASLINLQNGRPRGDENLSTYAGRLFNSLMTNWKDASIEQIATATILTHIAQFDNRVQRMSFTNEIQTRQQLQKELQALSFKRPAAVDNASQRPEKMRRTSSFQPKMTKCFNCNKFGHRQADCPEKRRQDQKFTPQRSTSGASNSGRCFKCGETGHFANRCRKNEGSVKTVNVCAVDLPGGTFKHNVVNCQPL
ncbi:uncharacterized protein [Atheta coriaria]|uniref:uncharacterized protein n=1 Tax=Dalotia coriaria TaxID=877792 RepID=UPI0031F476AF